MRKQLHNIYGDQSTQRRRFSPLVPIGVLTSIVLALIAGTVFVLPHRNIQAIPFLPSLERQELVTNQCSISPEGCLWSNHKPRIVRTSDDTVYIVYVSDGSGGAFNDKVWHLVRRNNDGTWQEIGSGPAGSEPSALLRAPNDDLYVVAFPQNARLDVTHFTKTGSGYTSSTQTLPGFGTTPTDAPYFGAGIDSLGDIAIDQTSWDNPATAATNPQFTTDIYWTYYDHLTQQWTYHDSPAGFRAGYLFDLVGENHDVQFAGVRDDQRSKIPGAPAGSWALINEVHDFSTTDSSTQQLTDSPITQEFPKTSDFIIAQSDDAYVDTQGRTHVLYMDIQNGNSRHAIIQNGKVIKDVPVPNPNYWWMRLVQDTTGRFYLISMDGGYLTVYPGAPGDTDGTQLDPPVNIPLQIPYSYCQAPHLTVPRGGTPLADYIDGFYEAGSCEQLVYFRLRLNGNASGGSTPTAPAQATATSTPTPQPGVTSTPTPTPPSAIDPPTSYNVYQSGLATGWSPLTNRSSTNLANTSPVLTGNHSIAWTANAWGTFALGNPKTLDITAYGFLHFAAQAGQAHAHYAVQLVGTNGKGLSSYVLLAKYGGDPVPGSWKTYDIPLSDLKADGQQIQAIGMQNYSGQGNQVMYMDDVKFTAKSSPSTPPPTATPSLSPSTPPPTATPSLSPSTPPPTATPSSPPSTPPTATLSSSPSTIYDGNLAQGWSQHTSQGSVTLSNTSPTFSGKQSIAWTSDAWGTFSLGNPQTMNTGSAAYLHFAAQAGQANSHYAIQIFGTNGMGLSPYLLLADYGGDPVPGQWKVYNIPLAALGAAGKQIEGITIQNSSGNSEQVLYLDDISFQ